MIPKTVFSEASQAFIGRLADLNQLQRLPDLARTVRDLVARGMAVAEILEALEWHADRLHLDPGPGEWDAFAAAVRDLAALPT